MLKSFLLTYFILFYGIAFLWRSYITWKKTGINPYRLSKQEGIHGYLGRLYRLVSIGVAVTILIYVFAENLYNYLTPIQWLEHVYVSTLGLTLLLASFTWILIAQSQMGRSWRIGIDEDNESELVTKGVFAVSRNPIFLGIRLNLVGFFFVLPNAFTLAIWLLGEVAIHSQVFLEEAYLQQAHGDAYQRYQAATSRYLGISKDFKIND
jgi:protein-S-isoprenylcysteine O-methyltransferase Ste14